MTAALSLVAARHDDDAPVAMWSAHDGADPFVMREDRARALAEQTRTALAIAGANLIELRAGNAHLALGYAAWHEFVADWFGDLTVYRLVQDRVQRVAERQALVASLTLAGHTVREQRDALGASVGTVHSDQRQMQLVPDRPLPTVVDEPEPLDPFRGLLPRWSALARVAAQGERGLTSLELDDELDAALGTATGSLSKLAGRGWVRTVDGLESLRRNRRPYVITDAGRARLAEVLAERDKAERNTTD